MVKFDNVIFEYIRRDEDGNVESINKALDEIKVHINPGEFIVILGANGSGKSTFARHINGLLTPTEGTVYTDGLDTKDDENTLEIRKAAGMVFQNPDNQIVASVVEEDVAFGLENMGVPSKEIRKRVYEALEKVGIAKYHDKSPNKLSGGQKQRVAIAGVLAMKNKCIILDEPTAMLDPLGRKEVLKTIHDLNKNENITVILITHYMQEAVDADKIIVMNSGKCVMSGTPRQVFAHVDELKKYKLEVPQVTELAYRLRKAGLNMPACVLTEDEFVAAIDAL